MEFLLSQFKEDGVLSCMICFDTVKNAHICPHCSKIYCLPCIEDWLRTSLKCPNCLRALNSTQLIKCRWMAEITELLAKIQNELKEIDTDKGQGDTLRVCTVNCGHCKKCYYEGKIKDLQDEIEEAMQERDLLLVEKDHVKEERKELQRKIEDYKQKEEILEVDRQIFQDEMNKQKEQQRSFSTQNFVQDKFPTELDETDYDLENEEGSFIDVCSTTDIKISSKILLPDSNMVGRFIGTAGRTIKHLEQITQCNMRVRGRGMRDGDETEPLHVEVCCTAAPEEVYTRMSNAVKHIRALIERFVADDTAVIATIGAINVWSLESL